VACSLLLCCLARACVPRSSLTLTRRLPPPQSRCYNATHIQRFEFHDSDVCYNSPFDLAPVPEPIALPGCVALSGGTSQQATCVREGGYLIRGTTYSTFYEYQNIGQTVAPPAGSTQCVPGESDVFVYDQLGPGVGPSGACYPFLSDASNVTSVSSISWSCGPMMTTYIDQSGPTCNNGAAVSWTSTPTPGVSPSPSPSFNHSRVRPNFPPSTIPVIAYVSPYDGSECTRQEDVGFYSDEYLTSQCPYSPPVAQTLSPGGVVAIVIASFGSIAIAAFAVICVLQAQRTLTMRKARAKARVNASSMRAVNVSSFRAAA
jgi:hypothetical protein